MARLTDVAGDFRGEGRSTYFMGAFRLRTADGRAARYNVSKDMTDFGIPGLNEAMGGLGGAIRGASQGGAVMGVGGAIVGGLAGAIGGVNKTKLADAYLRDGRKRFWIKFSDGRRLEAEMEGAIVAALRRRVQRVRRSR